MSLPWLDIWYVNITAVTCMQHTAEQLLLPVEPENPSFPVPNHQHDHGIQAAMAEQLLMLSATEASSAVK